MNTIKQRILDISYKYKLSHLGSCFSTLPILYNIYYQYPDIVILSNGHAGIAQYCCLESFFGYDAEQLYLKHGIHPCYDPEHRIYCSTGSLGMGFTVGVGYALAGKPTHIIISDGECAEGSVWEALNYLDEHPLPIYVHANINSLAAYHTIDGCKLAKKLKTVYPKIKIYFTCNEPLPDTLESHYHNLTKEEYEIYSSKFAL